MRSSSDTGRPLLLVLTPDELLARQATLVPPPRDGGTGRRDERCQTRSVAWSSCSHSHSHSQKRLPLAFRILSEFELKGDGGDHLLHFSAALRACLHWGVCELSLQFKLVAAGITLIFIYWHWLSILSEIDHAP